MSSEAIEREPILSRPSVRSRWDLRVPERRLLLLVSDLVAIAIALIIAIAVHPGIKPTVDARIVTWELSLGIAWLVSCAAFETYDLRAASRSMSSVLVTYKTFLLASVLFLAVPFVTAPLLSSRLSLVTYAVVSLALLPIGRLGYARFLTHPQLRCRALVVGTGPRVADIMMVLSSRASNEYAVVGRIGGDAQGEGLRYAGTWLGDYGDLPAVVQREQVREVILATNDEQLTRVADAIVDVYQKGTTVRDSAVVYEQLTGRVPVEHIGPHWFAALPHHAGGGRAYDFARRAVDMLVAAISLVALFPVFVIVTLAVILESGRPVVYRQSRVGYLGRPFSIAKFRTMFVSAEVDGPRWASRNDPRCTRVGRILRRTRLDETPQLWNVLVGDMTLIGPRPERPEFFAELVKEIPFYRSRLLVRPGITGWAQVRHRYASSVADTLEKLQYDLFYVKNRSVFLDLAITVKTVGVVLRASGQ